DVATDDADRAKRERQHASGRMNGGSSRAQGTGLGPLRRGAAVVAAAREADVELLELAIKMRALEAGALGDLAHVALLASEKLLEVDPLERFARFPQRKLEEARRDLGCDDLVRRRGLAEQPLHVIGGDLAANDLHVRHDA